MEDHRGYSKESPAAKKLLRIVKNAKGDNLERAEMAFRGLPSVTMQEKYGSSGRTRQTILNDYRHERAEWQAAKELLIRLLKEEKWWKIIHVNSVAG